MIDDDKTIIAQAKKITGLEIDVLRLTKENVRLTGRCGHYERTLEQDQKIILELKGKL